MSKNINLKAKAAKLAKKGGEIGHLNKRRFAYGSISIVLVVAFIACVIIANAGLSYLTDRYRLKIDITDTGLYEISETSRRILTNLKEDVTVYILMAEDEVQNYDGFAQANELLKMYRSLANEHFHIEYVDVYKNPTFLSQYQDTGEDLTSGSFIIQSDKRYKTCKLTDLYEYGTYYNSETDSNYSYISGYQADQTFATAIHYVTTDNLPTVALITGHDEYYSDGLLKIFTNNNFIVEEIALAFEEIPSNTAIVVMGAPQQDYTAEEIEKLDKYLSDDYGNVMAFTGISTEPTPNLDLYYEEWGIQVSDQLVCDSARAITSLYYVVPYVVDNTICSNLTSESMVVIPYGRAMSKLWDTSSTGRTATTVLESANTSYGKDYSDSSTTITTFNKEEGDQDGPFAMAIYSEYATTISSTEYTSKFLLVSSGYAVEDSYLGTSSLENQEFFTDAINYLYPSINAISIDSISLSSGSLIILEDQAAVCFWLLVVVFPVLVGGLGLYVWLKRRHL